MLLTVSGFGTRREDRLPPVTAIRGAWVEGQLWVLVVLKRFDRSLIVAFHAPEPFNIIGERKPVDRRRNEALPRIPPSSEDPPI
jgi:hypothetical protein